MTDTGKGMHVPDNWCDDAKPCKAVLITPVHIVGDSEVETLNAPMARHHDQNQWQLSLSMPYFQAGGCPRLPCTEEPRKCGDCAGASLCGQ